MKNRAQSREPGAGEHAADCYWAAVCAKDASFDGTFYFSVSTTGIYCRPSCPARPAKRAHVRFHATRADAEAAGFRPCKRCRPDAPPLRQLYAERIARACRLIEVAEQTPELAELAATAGLSPYHFHRVFKAAVGITPKAYAMACRSTRLREYLGSGASVTDAVYNAGYGSSSRFYAQTKEVLGMTPTRYRRGAAGETLRFAFGESALGKVLVAVSSQGVAAILLGDCADALNEDFAARFAGATLVSADAQLEETVSVVVRFVEATDTNLALPLDIRGTAFQHQVWEALRKIPAGTTATYAEIAKKMGRPTATRAVAAACAANPLAIAVPCHRVVRSDGGLSGYRWGVDRKRALLNREKTRAPASKARR